MALSVGQQRRAERIAHLVAGMVLLGYVYVPIPDRLQDSVRYLVVPVLVATGLAMWQAARFRRWRRRRAAT